MKLKRAASHTSAVILVVTAAGWSEAFQTATRSPIRLVQPQSASSIPRHHRWSFLVAPPPVPSTQIHSTTEEEAVDTTSKSKDSSSLAFESGANNKIGAQPIPYSDLTIGVLKETFPGENRVSQTPDTVALLVKAGFQVIVQSGGMFCFVLSNGLGVFI